MKTLHWLLTGREEGSVNPFITMSANNQKLDTGSHVDLKAWNMNLGFAKKINNNSGKLIIVPVIEYGRGSYDPILTMVRTAMAMHTSGVQADG